MTLGEDAELFVRMQGLTQFDRAAAPLVTEPEHGWRKKTANRFPEICRDVQSIGTRPGFFMVALWTVHGLFGVLRSGAGDCSNIFARGHLEGQTVSRKQLWECVKTWTGVVHHGAMDLPARSTKVSWFGLTATSRCFLGQIRLAHLQRSHMTNHETTSPALRFKGLDCARQSCVLQRPVYTQGAKLSIGRTQFQEFFTERCVWGSVDM